MGENKRRWRAVFVQEDLMVEIMSRVPAKSLLRFKSVSKQWKSMIGDPTFVTLHHKRAHSQLDGGSLLIIFPTLGQPLFSAPYEGGAALPLLQNRPQVISSYEASPSSCHGLILLFERSRFTNRPVFKIRPVIVFNPTTRKLIPLPPLENNVKNLERKNPGDDSRLFVHDCSLGFDPLTGVYKVLSRCTFIRFHSSRYPNWEQIGCYMYYVFTLGIKEWRKLGTPNIPSHKLDYYSVCVNGVIYFKADRFYQAHDFIVSFNVGEEKFSLVSPPQAPPLYRQLMEFKGRLALREDTEEKTVVWVLEDHSQDKWTPVELENCLEWIHGGKTYTLVGGVVIVLEM